MTTAILGRKILKLFAFFVWTLLFGELFLRLLAPQALMPRYITDAGYGVRGNIPGAIYHHSTPDVDIEYRINKQGMRDDRIFSEAKSPGTCRIAMLGDSYFVGYELGLPQTFQHQLELMLREKGKRVDVLNFAVSGFGTAENLRTYEAAARKYHPNLVLMQWQVTDYDDNVRSALYRMQEGKLVAGAKSFLPGVATQDWLMSFAAYRALADHSHLFNFAREKIGWQAKQLLAFVRKREAGPAENEIEQNTYVINEAQVALAAAILRKADAEIRGDGSKLMIVDIPNRTPARVFSSSYDLMPTDIRRALTPVSALPAFRSALRDPNARLFFEHGARHLTPLGARLLARAAVERIEASGGLEGCN
jgi:hypothetical protein